MIETRDPLWGLPDPATQAEFYADTAMKRLAAWVIDTVLILLAALVILPFTAFVALLFLPVFVMTVGFLYRMLTLAAWSATPGMRAMAVEFRTHRGERFDLTYGFLHTLGYTASMSLVLPQLISAVLMATHPRGQGLTDLVLGTAAVNRARG